jgi:hypothetical protein
MNLPFGTNSRPDFDVHRHTVRQTFSPRPTWDRRVRRSFVEQDRALSRLHIEL